MTHELIERALRCDAALKAARTVAEMKAAITARKAVRGEMERLARERAAK
jgi:hypothetical protein